MLLVEVLRIGSLAVSRDDIWAFLGIVVCMGIHRLPRIPNYWSSESLLGVPQVQKSMSLNRFWSIWSNLHVVDNATLSPGDGLSAKIQPVLDVLGRTFYTNYSPGQEVCIDEAMVKYKGQVKKGKVKMPRKPIKQGFKIWCCCCACCGYLCTFELYEGKPTDACTGEKKTEKGLTMRVVKDLLSSYAGLNHVVYMDNFFTSGPLVDALLLDQIYTVGTIKQRACGYPSELKDLKLDVGDYAVRSVGETCYYAFQDRKLVSFVSNVFPETMQGKVARLPPDGKVLRYKHVPPVLPAYNKYMGAVDRLSQVRKTYGFDRKSRRYWIRPFFTFFDYAVNNAHVLYKHQCASHGIRKPMELLRFRLDLARLLMRDTRCRKRVHENTDSSSMGCPCELVRVGDMRPSLARGRCYHCTRLPKSGHKVRSTSLGCSNCRVRLCKIPCFAEFHAGR